MKQDERKRKRGKEKKWARGADEKDERRKGKGLRATAQGKREKQKKGKGKTEKGKGKRGKGNDKMGNRNVEENDKVAKKDISPSGNRTPPSALKGPYPNR